MRHTLLLGLLAGILVTNAGCHGLLHHALYAPVGPGLGCGTGYCADGCGECATCEPACTTSCDAGCATCETACTADCPPSCGPVYHKGPLTCILRILHWSPCHHWGHGCEAGCGEKYWGEFYSDPPARCDPCDHYGNWIGGGCATGTCATGGCTTTSCTAGACQGGPCATGSCETGTCASGKCVTGDSASGHCATGDCASANYVSENDGPAVSQQLVASPVPWQSSPRRRRLGGATSDVSRGETAVQVVHEEVRPAGSPTPVAAGSRPTRR
jgi:hypothetical protein